jgi:hypothetical protein
VQPQETSFITHAQASAETARPRAIKDDLASACVGRCGTAAERLCFGSGPAVLGSRESQIDLGSPSSTVFASRNGAYGPAPAKPATPVLDGGDLWHRCSESDGSLNAKHALGLGKEGGHRGDAVDAPVAGGCSVSRAAARCSAPSCKVRVDECSPIKASRVLPDVNVGRGASLECVLLDKCCCLPDGFEAGAERGVTQATAEMLAGCPAAP